MNSTPGTFSSRKTNSLLGAAASLILCLPYSCANAVTALGTINVTANRTAITADQTLASVTIITQDEIKASQSRDLTTLIDGLPGVTISNNGGLNKSTSVRLRGTGSNHVLVLIDGIRIGSATLGLAAFQHIPLDHVERIEIVRGPRSQLYGADALGGVIQIFTSKGSSGHKMRAEASYGSHNTVTGSIGISGMAGNTDYSLSLSHRKTDGFNALKNNNPDKDGSENQALAAHLSHRFGSGLKATVNLLRSKGNSDYDSAWGPANSYDNDFLQQVVTGKFEYSPNDWWDTYLSLGESRDETTNFTNNTFTSFFETKRKQINWQNDFMVGESGLMTIGLDFLRDTVDGSSDYSVNERDNTGLFVQYQTEFGPNSLIVGLRRDDNESFGGHNTRNIDWGRDLSNDLRVTAAYGTAFRAPTFNDLYYQDPWGSNGNPNLTPEESRTLELGLEGRQDWGNWDLRLFQTDIEGLIDWVEIAPWTYQPQNINEARIKGVEASTHTQLADWKLSANLTLLDPRNSNTNKLLIYRSEQTLRVDITRAFGKTEVGASLHARSHHYSDVDNTRRSGGFGTVDLKASHRLGEEWIIQGKIQNLFDRDYETIRTYNTGGRELFVTITYEPK